MPANARTIADKQARFIDEFCDKLLAGCRLAFARPLSTQDFHSSPRLLITALVGASLLVALGQKLAAGADATFWIWGAMAFASRLLAWLVALALVLKIAGAGRSLVALLTTLIYAALPIAVTGALFLHLQTAFDPEADGGALRTGVLLWTALVFARTCHYWLMAGWLPVAAATALYVLALCTINAGLPNPSMFYPPEPESSPAVDVESVYYLQQPLVLRQMNALHRHMPGTIDMYFVGIGPYSAEDVFMRETLGAKTIVEDRLGARNRAAVLLNSRHTMVDYPLANTPNLHATLALLAKLIDRNEDIVFLFLTSHGSEDAILAAEFAELRPNDLSAENIRSALDEAGIRWRIIVISACYSGSFIDTLADERTLIITAAAADRASFGCAHSNDWTYFGEAYFADALAAGLDPVAAFDAAATAVAEREKREHKLASHPQMMLGDAMAAHLTRWRAQSPPSTKSR